MRHKGIDMIANYALQHYDEKFVRIMALDSLEFDPEQSHTQFYRAEQHKFKDYMPRLPSKSEG
jgi:hypothetical protein